MNDLSHQNVSSNGVQRREIRIEEGLETLSRYLDGLVRVPGTNFKFGLDSILGLVPGVGDTATTITSFYILLAAVRYRVPKITILRMALNLAIDYAVGTIPLVGDAFDFVWKANKKNIQLIRERAEVSAEDAKRGRISDYIFVLGIIGVLLVMAITCVLLGLYAFGLILKSFAAQLGV